MMDQQTINESPPLTIIDAESSGRLVDWQELGEYRDLFFFLVSNSH